MSFSGWSGYRTAHLNCETIPFRRSHKRVSFGDIFFFSFSERAKRNPQTDSVIPLPGVLQEAFVQGRTSKQKQRARKRFHKTPKSQKISFPFNFRGRARRAPLDANPQQDQPNGTPLFFSLISSHSSQKTPRELVCFLFPRLFIPLRTSLSPSLAGF